MLRIETLKESGPPIPDDGLSVDALATGCLIRPVEGLPALHDADLHVHIVGRDAVVSLGKATADLSPGRKLVLSSGVFEVPDTAPRAPPARVRFKLDGPLQAAVELLRMDRLARCGRRAVRPLDDARNDKRAGDAGNAAEGGSAARLDQLRDHARCHEFFRRPHDHGTQGGSGVAAGDRQRRRASSSRAMSRSPARRRASTIARRAARPRPKSACKARSTRRRAPTSASIRATRSVAPFPCGSPAGSPPHLTARAALRSRPI